MNIVLTLFSFPFTDSFVFWKLIVERTARFQTDDLDFLVSVNITNKSINALYSLPYVEMSINLLLSKKTFAKEKSY
jgi:hypothetical protein